MTKNILEELRNFEKEQEEKLQQKSKLFLDEVEKARKDIKVLLMAEEKKLEKERSDEVTKAKDQAKEEAKKITEEYRKRTGQLEKKSSKNFNAAVDKIFSLILEKNV